MSKNLADLLSRNTKSVPSSEFEDKPLPEDDVTSPKKESLIQNLSKKITKTQKFKRENYGNAKLTGLGHLRNFKDKRFKSQYQIEVKYHDIENPQVEKKKLVRFGNVDDEDYIHHKDNVKRMKTLSRIHKNDENFLHPTFYRVYLLNSKHLDINHALLDLQETLGIQCKV